MTINWYGWLLLACTLTAQAQPLPDEEPAPGGIIRVALNVPSGTQAYFGKHRVMLLEQDGKTTALIGISLTTKPGQHTLSLKLPNGSKHSQRFEVKTKKYATQHITLKNKRMVNPTAEDLKRIRKERIRIDTALVHWRDSNTPGLAFVQPTQGIVSDSYGRRRFFNKQPRKPHSGQDIAAPQGTPIISPADGRVVEMGHFFFNGKSVFIDHGQGLVTMFSHMNNISVTPGQILHQGDQIGTVGATGRVTGPHLHWGVSLNRAMVNPSLFIAQGSPPAGKTDRLSKSTPK